METRDLETYVEARYLGNPDLDLRDVIREWHMTRPVDRQRLMRNNNTFIPEWARPQPAIEQDIAYFVMPDESPPEPPREVVINPEMLTQAPWATKQA